MLANVPVLRMVRVSVHAYVVFVPKKKDLGPCQSIKPLSFSSRILKVELFGPVFPTDRVLGQQIWADTNQKMAPHHQEVQTQWKQKKSCQIVKRKIRSFSQLFCDCFVQISFTWKHIFCRNHTDLRHKSKKQYVIQLTLYIYK